MEPILKVGSQMPPLFLGADEQGIYLDLGPQAMKPMEPLLNTPRLFLAIYRYGWIYRCACMHVKIKCRSFKST